MGLSCIFFTALLLTVFWSVHADELPTCQAKDFHYEYTECDSNGGRWRVSVPVPNTCVDGAPNPPVRGKSCDFTCEAGQYLEIQGDQECHKCPAGTFSLGGGVRFEEWQGIPKGFAVETEGFQGPDILSSTTEHNNCSNSGWVAKGAYLSANAEDRCYTKLIYTTDLVRAGYLRFEYQFRDETNQLFHINVQNSQCATSTRGGNLWLTGTEEGEWKRKHINLKQGPNTLVWKVMAFNTGQTKHSFKPVLIRNVEISGVAYTSECTKCRNGTHSDEGANICSLCKENTYSLHGAASCTPCDQLTEYSEAGATKCLPRPACKESDYFEYFLTCDKNGQTQKLYKWIEPQICRTDVPGAIQLPPSGEKKPCPPCNPGMQRVDNSPNCTFCPANTVSDGSKPCAPCPVSTAAKYEINYHWWNDLPQNMTTSCARDDDEFCLQRMGWQPLGDHLSSGKGHQPEDYLVVMLRLGGVQGEAQMIGGKAKTLSTVSFVFDLNCDQEKKASHPCIFYFTTESESIGMNVVKFWSGHQEKQEFSFPITQNEEMVFSWAFQGATVNEEARIYSIKITNTIEGGASVCEDCPMGTQKDGCVPCPEGHYIDRNSSTCVQCPENTIITSNRAYGIESCIPCGKGLVSKDRKTCSSDCHFKDKAGHEYDFTSLRGFHTTAGSTLFTSSGTQYYHHFNFTICGTTVEETTVQCPNNVSTVRALLEQDYASTHLDNATNNATTTTTPSPDTIMKRRAAFEFDQGGEQLLGLVKKDMTFILKDKKTPPVNSLVCRNTIIPPTQGEGYLVAAQPVSLGDSLLYLTSNDTDLSKQTKKNFDGEDLGLLVHYVHRSEIGTNACPSGRTTVITLNCDVTQKGQGKIQVPPKCSDGTCDGCNYHFLWSTEHACPICKELDYEKVIGQCVNGVQEVHYYPPKHCILTSNSQPVIEKRHCRLIPFWAMAGIGGIVFLAALLCGLVIFCWSKNKSLEYKYMKLVEGSGQDGELPAAETCALDEGEDEVMDSVKFSGKGFFKKLKSMAGKTDDDNPFESIKLTEKSSLT
ncbi:UPF0577 protein KIAA1324-like homolog isoform X2 [Lingula anatina]|uniref:UPF0577 protein KIAA1324-like homolog isoform X2 n=1 Tax=Lingula anatina TaxID=7574 RepID=A0A1S3JP70_LINAN|nr:UPF0577 protein KIAA1324-like homolog isoform X2 [Lingula anatina]|eukprot:XP_013411931.1 UPF0577 protein KIAA1324-like homolog isoform X2 [Lingula anatina]